MRRIVGGSLGVVAIVVAAWILSLPSKAECVASGRTVDPTERHCDSATGYEQLEEHAVFHTVQVLVWAVPLAGGYLLYRYVRRRRRANGASPDAS